MKVLFLEPWERPDSQVFYYMPEGAIVALHDYKDGPQRVYRHVGEAWESAAPYSAEIGPLLGDFGVCFSSELESTALIRIESELELLVYLSDWRGLLAEYLNREPYYGE